MTVFLTSSPTGDLDGKYQVSGLDNRSGFLDELRSLWPEGARCLMITAFPDDDAANDEMRSFFHNAVITSGLSCRCFNIFDGRTDLSLADTIPGYDVIFLGGGHVPTQREFFRRLSLRQRLKGFGGIIIGISAGTMNCAGEVYSMPELDGESVDPAYERFFPGLGLTDINVIPHYQMTYGTYLDGKHLYEDIILPDSAGRRFLCLPDGSYVCVRDGEAAIHGPHRWIVDGEFE